MKTGASRKPALAINWDGSLLAVSFNRPLDAEIHLFKYQKGQPNNSLSNLPELPVVKNHQIASLAVATDRLIAAGTDDGIILWYQRGSTPPFLPFRLSKTKGQWGMDREIESGTNQLPDSAIAITDIVFSGASPAAVDHLVVARSDQLVFRLPISDNLISAPEK